MIAVKSEDRAQTGISGLDDVLGGGLPRHHLYLIRGTPGVGKTTFALQFLREGVRHGESVLYVCLSETEEEMQSVAASHGWSLDGIELYELAAMERLLAEETENSVFHPADVELTETFHALVEVLDRIKPSRVVFDSLSEIRLLAREPLRYRRQILALKQYFVGKECTVLLLDDQTIEEADLQLHSIAHGVILLEQNPIAYGIDRRRLRIQKMRGVAFRSGYHDIGMVTGGMTVYPRLIAAEHRHDQAEGMICSGVPGLDELLGGGIDRGVSALLLGPAGAGKSTVALTYAYAAAKRGERVLVLSFEESPRTLYKRTRTLGMDLKRYVDSGHINIHHIDPAEMSPDEFIQLVRDEVSRGDVSLVMIDSLNGYLNAMPEERFLILQMHELLMYLGQIGVTSLLVVAQHGIMGPHMGQPVDISYLADTVLLFRLFELQGRLRQAISVVKRRGGEHDRAIRELQFIGQKGIQLGEPLEGLRGIMTGVPVTEQGT